MYDRQVVRRRRAALAVLVALSLVLLTAYFGESPSGLLHGIQRGAQEVLAPIEEGASRAFKPFRDIANWTGDVLSARGDNERLRRELADARRQLAQSQTAARDSAELRRLVGLPRREGFPQGTEPVAARVIARSPTVWHSSIQIDKGRSEGVRVDQPVVTGDGLVGRVASVSRGTARVTLITDASSAVSAQIVPDGASGILKPAVGNPEDLQLDFVEKRNIRDGQTVITSGFRFGRLSSLFPRGIPIGRVTRVDPDELELYQRVHVRPFADFRRMEFVQVLTSKPDTETVQVPSP